VVIDTTALELKPDAAAGPVGVLQAVADPVRWTVLATLAQGPRCVCSLQEHVPVAGNLLSYHLKVLREAGLITSSRRGRWIDYALAHDARDRMAAALPGASAGATAGVQP
jgi:ArsR family transcriptional regulator